MEEKQRLIFEIINRITQIQALEIVEVKIEIHRKDVHIQILADKLLGRISIEECTQLNRSIVEAIDKEGFFSEDGYSLEVASPGLDRPLVTYKDYLRNINVEIRIWFAERIAGKVEHVGVIKSVTETSLTLLMTKEKKEIIVPIDQVVKALLEI